MLFMHLRVICSNHPPHARVQVEPAFEPRQLFVQSIGVNSAAGRKHMNVSTSDEVVVLGSTCLHLTSCEYLLIKERVNPAFERRTLMKRGA